MVDKSSRHKLYYEPPPLKFDDLIDHLNKAEQQDEKAVWVYRGQLANYELQTTLEREFEKSGIDLSIATKMEDRIIREFKRLYDGDDRKDVINDTLYCMSLLQHHGAPTRLLDFSYSKYVAIYFGLKAAYNSIETKGKPVRFALWCVDTTDMNSRAEKYCGENGPLLMRSFENRWDIDKRNDESFSAIYMAYPHHNLVISENPARIHKRLHLQQGVLLCPGNVEKPFIENLESLYNKEKTEKVKKLVCKLQIADVQEAFEILGRMNITEESLFPGLDGLARSVNYNMWLTKRIIEVYKNKGVYDKSCDILPSID